VRTRFKVKEAGEPSWPQEWSLVEKPLGGSLLDVLSLYGLEEMTLKYKGGLSVRYAAPEYPCTYCGEYGHEESNCPVEAREKLEAEWVDYYINNPRYL